MTYKVEYVSTGSLEARLNEIAAEGWVLVACHAHPFDTSEGRPIYVTIWSKG